MRASDGAILRHYTQGEAFGLSRSEAEAGAPHSGTVLRDVEMAQAGGVVFAMLNGQSSGQARVCAVRASDGRSLWCEGGLSEVLPLIVSDESLYIQGETSITALRASDGALLWQHAIQRDGPGAPRAIAVADGLLYLPMGEHQVCALRAADGTDAWCASLDTADPIYSLVADTMGAYALTYNDSHDETSGREELIALRAANGGIMWKQSLLGRLLPARANFTAQHGLVYLTTTAEKQYTFTAFQHDTGAVRWATNSYDNPVVAVQDDVVYLGSSTRGAQPLQARDASMGALLWNWAKKFSYEKPPDAYTDRLITSGGMVYLLDTTHDLYAIRAGDGKMLWEHLQCTNEDDGSDTDTPGATKWCGWGADRQNGGPIVPLALASGG